MTQSSERRLWQESRIYANSIMKYTNSLTVSELAGYALEIVSKHGDIVMG
jgi:hypothetical protein